MLLTPHFCLLCCPTIDGSILLHCAESFIPLHTEIKQIYRSKMANHQDELWSPVTTDYDFWQTNDDFSTFSSQQEIGREPTRRTSSNQINNFESTRTYSWSTNNASVPRTVEVFSALDLEALGCNDAGLELQTLLHRDLTATNNEDIGSAALREAQFRPPPEEEPEYTIRREILNETPRSNAGPTPEEWEAKKPEIYALYVEQRWSCREVMEKMADRGFYATVPMYKRRFSKWDWPTYRTRSKGSRGNPSIRRAGRATRKTTSNLSLAQHDELTHVGVCNTLAAFKSPPSSFAYVSTINPRFMLLPGSDETLKIILHDVKRLYSREISQGNWKVTNRCEVEEDVHDNLLAGIGTALRNLESLGDEIGFLGIRKAFMTLEGVVSRCGLFSLPAIWESFLRLILKKRPDIAQSFLTQAIQLAVKFGHEQHHEFVQVLVNLQKIQKTAPEQLQKVVCEAYRSCIDHLKSMLSVDHLTTLQLWSDFVVYLDRSSVNEAKAAVKAFRKLIKKSEKDNGIDDDYTLELLGLTLYLLQSTPSMADEAEIVALDMLVRVNRRTEKGEKLKGALLITWKDLKHTLGDFCHAKGEDSMAITHLEEYLEHGVEDDRDIIALEKLEEWHTLLENHERASYMRRWRETSVREISQEGYKIPREKEPSNDESEFEDGDGESENAGSSEATVVDQAETRDSKVGERADVGEDGEEEDDENVQVEMQLFREQEEHRERALALLQK
ncbi:uncharacterized protein LY89DRAFT_776697 [Mollisia scopiformis]|uniref:Clr5 domain-containing protein n=1 Tax=Mollisia scopiformis TaxID=149040 RepID=A0A194XX20_MOLSC|nr:uncharacterized protein LY89DRAFT_776697 [Mollisia scopiformis]KUJ24619.1 hypothetical protein LY89DRAFT_776697 [Mollisia scopiformis]